MVSGARRRGNANRTSAVTESRLHIDEATGYLRNGDYSKAIFSYNQVHLKSLVCTMTHVENIETGLASAEAIRNQASDILKPTLQDNDFLKSFVRISLEDNNHEESRPARSKRSRDLIDKENQERRSASVASSKMNESFDGQEEPAGEATKGRDRDRKRLNGRTESKALLLDEEMNIEKTRKKKRRRNGVRLDEEIYTDKDRAAAVNMGSRDIKQSLRLKQRQDRSRVLQIPEEADPSAMLALGAREIHSGDVRIAVNCINKALQLSPDDKNALIARSKCYLLLGEPRKALQDAETAMQEKAEDPNNARAIYYKAEALYHLGDFELSLVYYYRGMKIRPEFDKFRLGVQKVHETVQSILGSNAVPMSVVAASTRVKNDEGENSHVAKLDVVKSDVVSSALEELEPYCRIKRNEERNSRVNEKVNKQWQYSLAAKCQSSAHNHLRQLSADRKYLQNLLKHSDIKAAHQVSARHITTHVEEGVEFLKTRQEFWRQQQATRHFVTTKNKSYKHTSVPKDLV